MNIRTQNILGISANKPERSGVDLKGIALLKEEEKWNAIPTIDEAVYSVNKIIKDEQRSTVVIPSNLISMDDEGKLNIQDGLFTEEGFKKFLTTLNSRGASFLLECDPDVRAYAVNRMLSKRTSDIKLHTRNNANGGREVYSVTGPKFPDMNNAVNILNQLGSASPEGTKAVWSYNSNKATVRFETLLKGFGSESYRVGDVHKAGIKWLIRDSGFGSILPMFIAYRHRCANMAMLSSNKFELTRTVHRGKMEDIKNRLELSFNEASQMLNQFYTLWEIASNHTSELKGLGTVNLLSCNYQDNSDAVEEKRKSIPTYDVRDYVYEHLLGKYPDLILHKDSKATLSSYKSGFNAEPSMSWKGFINGITAVARKNHTSSDIKNRLESTAGKILEDLTA